MAENKNGAAVLKHDIKTGNIGSLYLIGGDESYLKQHYVQALIQKTVDPAFQEFNLHILEGEKLTPDRLLDAIESAPVFSERKLILIKDYDIYKATGELKAHLPEILEDIPSYSCLVFYYDTIPLKVDKRLKLHTTVSQKGCIAEFQELGKSDLSAWIRRRFRAEKKDIDDETCEYFMFYCGTSMVNLVTEIDKLCAHTTKSAIAIQDIQTVCSKVLTAAVFDLTDAVAEKNFKKAMELSRELMDKKNDEIMLLSMLSKHFQRLYAVKLSTGRTEKDLMRLIGTNSAYYLRKLRSAASKINLSALRHILQIFVQADTMLKSTGVIKEEAFYLMLIKIADALGELK